MARGRKKQAVVFQEIVDATPERIIKALAINDDGEILDDGSEWINAAEIDPREQAINRVRRFRHTMLDRLHHTQKLTWVQWYAGDRYRETYARSQIESSAIASYGERTSNGEIAYGLPRTIGQLKARQIMREYRQAIPTNMRGFMDRFLIRDALPRYGGRAHNRQVSDIRNALDTLAQFMRLGD